MKNIIFFVLIILLTACSTKPHAVVDQSTIGDAEGGEVYVVAHDWHTGFVIPAKLIQTKLPTLKQRFGDSPYIEFGWGDKGFYQAKEITASLVIRAIFWPTESVVHAVAVPDNIDRYFPRSEIILLSLNKGEFESLINFIVNSFHKNRDGKIVALKEGIYGNSEFYQGVGSYHLLNTCNSWTAKGLKSAGFDISTTFKLTKGSVLNYLRDKS